MGNRVNEFGIELLTYKGTQQVITACQHLHDERIIQPLRIVYSGAERTLQCATIAQLTLDLKNTVPEIHRGFFQDDLIFKYFGKNPAVAFEAEINRVYEDGDGTLEYVLKISEYARQARSQIQKSILEAANRYGNSIVFSHGVMGELGALNTAEIKYAYGLADTILYHIEGGVIVKSEYIAYPPIQDLDDQ